RARYPASSVLRTPPPPQPARPVPHGRPVEFTRLTAWGLPCCVRSPLRTCRRHYPGGIAGLGRFSGCDPPFPSDGGLPRFCGGAAPPPPPFSPSPRSPPLHPSPPPLAPPPP